MTIFVDASALVAILACEPGFEGLAKRIMEDGRPIWSAISRWEASRALCRLLDSSPQDIDALLTRYAEGLYRLVPIGEREAELALEAHQRYGKGNHPAQLNMGDCFAYACAMANGAKLLYKGDEFAKTDLA